MDIFRNEKEDTYSGDINQFDTQCKELIDYIKMCLEDTSNHFLFLTRIGNDIIFGRSTEGTREKLITIKMVSPSDFKKIYESIKGEFESIFVENTKHTFGIGWSLVPFIGENIMIQVESSNQYDTEWIYDVVHYKSSTK